MIEVLPLKSVKISSGAEFWPVIRGLILAYHCKMNARNGLLSMIKLANLCLIRKRHKLLKVESLLKNASF